MTRIDIRRPHDKSIKDAKAAVDKVAAEIGRKFDFSYGWTGNALHFERSGVSGRIALEKGMVHVTAELGLLLSMLKTAVEQEIEKRLDEHFGKR